MKVFDENNSFGRVEELNSNWRGFVGECDHEIIDSEYIKSFKEFFFETKEKNKGQWI